MNEPVTDSTRSCVGCRQKDAREALLRFVADGDPPRFAPDVRRRAYGRGVSVHPRFRCVEAAVRSGALRRALEVDAQTTARELSQSAAAQYNRRAEGLLLAARRAKLVALGTEAARDAIAARSVRLLIVASDAEGDRETLTEAAARLGSDCLVWRNKQELGALFGRALLSIVAVLDVGIASELRHVVRCAAELAEDS
jgi:predicted RNA-binding protein YlxR (DUF448 family)/ribosomal protein L30E